MEITKPILAIGLMSGTSLDGVDAALIETDGERVTALRESLTIPYTQAFRDRLFHLLQHKRDAGDNYIRDVEVELTKLHAVAVKELCKKANVSAGEVKLIGFHGQTIDHNPAAGFTWQIGDGALLAEETGISVVNDFRTADVKAGGQGAPLVPVYHQAIVKAAGIDELPVVILNIGGVANITYVADELIAFDTGTGNALIDDWVLQHTGRHYDKDGVIARSGNADMALVETWMQNAYFKAPYPKSLDRNHFKHVNVEALTLENGAATLTEFTVQSIKASESLLSKSPAKWFVAGGGVHNRYMLERLNDVLTGEVSTITALSVNGIPVNPDAVEAQAFAYLAARSVRKLPYGFPKTTGVKTSLAVGGVFYPA